MYKIIQGDCIEAMKGLPDKFIRCIVTSPPYYGLRDYGVPDQIGLEPTPEEYIARLVAVFREAWRVLADDGTVWLNLGDSYWGGKGQSSQAWSTEHLDRNTLQKSQHQITGKGETRPTDGKHPVIKPKDLIMIPARVALALQADGWYLRSEIVWHKTNPMPESVKDRPTRSHEMIYLLTKSKSYYYDANAIREPARYPGDDRKARVKSDHKSIPDGLRNGLRAGNYTYDLDTRNKRDVWTVSTKPYRGAHFATFPPDLIEPCILASTSEKGQCPNCGKPWVRKIKYGERKKHPSERQTIESGRGEGGDMSKHAEPPEKIDLGFFPSCNCNRDPIPDRVFDPFNGAGTTGLVALKHGRDYYGAELNPEYIKLTHERLKIYA